MEVPLTLLLAKHRPCGIRLVPKPPRWTAPVEVRIKPKGTKVSFQEAAAFAQALSKKEFMEGDFLYWIGVPPETGMVICRACQRPVRNEKNFRKNHLRNQHCSEVLRKLAEALADKPWCVKCGGRENSLHHLWHWGYKFCSRVCIEEFKYSFILAPDVMGFLVGFRKEYGL